MSRPADPQRRDTILQAAAEVFIEKGYSEARLSDIAERAGIVTSTLYLYFESKEQMVGAIVEVIRSRFGAGILPVLANLKSRDDLEICIQQFMDFAIEKNNMLKLWRLDSGLRGVPNFNIKASNAPMFDEAVQLLERQMDERTLNRYDPNMLMHILISLARWIFESTPLLDSEEERENFRENCVEWLAHALFPSQTEIKE